MFLDLSGSTGVVEAIGPERSRDLLHAMQTLAEREVTERRGIVINFTGDGVLAVFGLPKPQSDDAARAFATVESLHASVAAWIADLPAGAAMLGYLSVQSSPVRVSNCARPPSIRAAMRKPSSLISCTH
jgi:adenylate cyclase